jgi:UDP-3-O-[3-hydroxymyristoyl] glucosamine N-acyltransferase
MRLSDIAAKIDCRMVADSDIEIERIAGIDEAGPGDLTFVSNRRYVGRIKTTRASAIILAEDLAEVPIPSLRTSNPYLAFARALELFYQPPAPTPGIHRTAVISEGVEIGPNPCIGAFAVVGARCTLGRNVVLYPHAVVYPGAIIGDDCIIHSHVVVREHCRLGARVIIQNGAVIGSDGFGFAPLENGSYYKICQTGRVLLEDDVEIGANTTIDRAAVGDTIIRRGAKLDNLVQIGHGSQVGEDSVLAAQVGLAGSTKLGKNVRAGGQAGFAGHLEVGDNAVITAQSATSHDVAPGAIISGSPAIDNSVWLRAITAFARLPALVRRIRDLEKQVEQLRKSGT